MTAIQIVEYVRQHGRVTQIIQESGDAENGPDLDVSPLFQRLGPLSLLEDGPEGILLVCHGRIIYDTTAPGPVF